MTTGRINQVTILSPSAEAREQTPRRRPGCTGRKGRRRSEPQPQASEVCETPKPQATDSIAPTEFPRQRSAATEIGLVAAIPRCLLSPGGGNPRPVIPRRVVTGRSPPPTRWWCDGVAMRPRACNGACCARQQGFGSHCRADTWSCRQKGVDPALSTVC